MKAELAASHPDLVVEVELVRDRPVESLIARGDRHAAPRRSWSATAGRVRCAARCSGSITYEIVHRSPVPVVVVPDPEDA